MRKLGRPTEQRMALLRNQATNLLWNGKIETTLDKAKEVKRYAEKILTLAINSYEDAIKVTKQVNENGTKVEKEFINDGVKKLNARRSIMSKLYIIKEQRAVKESADAFKARTKDIKYPLIEKIFNELAPKYAKRKEELGIGGGYTRIIKLGTRQGDNAQMAILELI